MVIMNNPTAEQSSLMMAKKIPRTPRLRSSSILRSFFLKRNSPERACICRSGRKCDAIASNTVCLTDKWALLSLIFQDIFTIRREKLVGVFLPPLKKAGMLIYNVNITEIGKKLYRDCFTRIN